MMHGERGVSTWKPLLQRCSYLATSFRQFATRSHHALVNKNGTRCVEPFWCSRRTESRRRRCRGRAVRQELQNGLCGVANRMRPKRTLAIACMRCDKNFPSRLAGNSGIPASRWESMCGRCNYVLTGGTPVSHLIAVCQFQHHILL